MMSFINLTKARSPRKQTGQIPIYAVCDYDNLLKYSITLEQFVQFCCDLNVHIIQYRDKNGSLTQQRDNLCKLRKLWDKTLIINDKIELISMCDGLHLGQEDLARFSPNKQSAIKRVRRRIGNAFLGLSTHDLKEVLQANTLDIDYIGLGAYKKSATKEVLRFVIGKRVSSIAKRSLKPVAVIGSVKVSDTIKNVDFLAVGSDIIRYYQHTFAAKE